MTGIMELRSSRSFEPDGSTRDKAIFQAHLRLFLQEDLHEAEFATFNQACDVWLKAEDGPPSPAAT